jgi:hypothetical protein
MTNIVVVQFNDYVQTSRDKKYNLTCYFSGPGEAVVTSNYLDTKTDPLVVQATFSRSPFVHAILYFFTPTDDIQCKLRICRLKTS